MRADGVTLRAAALTAGLGYLLSPVIFAQAYAMPRLVVDDAGQTLVNLQAHPHLFAAALLCYFVCFLADVVVAWGLYWMFAPVNRAVSLLAAWLQLVYAAMAFAATLNLVTVYRLIAVPHYTGLFAPAAQAAQVKLLLGGFRGGFSLSLVLFGLHLVVLGWPVVRSTYAPTWLGVLLVLDGCAWVVDSLSLYLFPNARLGFLNVFYVGEIVLMVWLLWWGRRERGAPEEALSANV